MGIPNNKYMILLDIFNIISYNVICRGIILIPLIRNISVLVSQGQDKFAFGEALTENELSLCDFLVISAYKLIIP